MLDHISHVEKFPLSMLDLGTGTGILAIAGALLGIPLIIACDNDEDAIENCRENLELNGMSDRISLHAKPLIEMTGQYHLVTANLLTHLLCENVGKLRSLTCPGGVLLLSGILTEDRERIKEAFDGKGFRIIAEKRCDEWLGISLVRAQPISP